MAAIGIIGAGRVAKALARRFTHCGLTVLISNSRGPHSLYRLSEDLGRCRQATLGQTSRQEKGQQQANRKIPHEAEYFKRRDQVASFEHDSGEHNGRYEMLDSLLDPIKDDGSLPFALRRKKKRKNKSISNHL
ncbi:NAD(P)-binding domain-containing protein [Dyadobacter subterraneus]|uniref:NAD(P)-binding domain-containing protein n=1 Tax=Dyadobacter subterraneus TaxID=2773304 RepID=A0ABR9WAA2_9BACT|nr:NAD(P)-binding domain-containing protein [Dyadobacter subterraneus]MBE9461881.1 NAD(P)-binding domain-containing protein [Dyadobacter subterraneus]